MQIVTFNSCTACFALIPQPLLRTSFGLLPEGEEEPKTLSPLPMGEGNTRGEGNLGQIWT